MIRYALTEYKEASDDVRAVYDDYMRVTGDTKVPVWLKSMGHSAALARSYWERSKGTLFAGSIPLPLKEMIVFVVSGMHGAKYCTACHAQSVLQLDKSLNFEDLQAFISDSKSFQMPESYRRVVHFAMHVVEDANKISDEEFNALQDDGFTLLEIGEIISVIDLASMFNIYTSTLRLHLDPEYRAII